MNIAAQLSATTAARCTAALLIALACGDACPAEALSDEQLDALTAGASESHIQDVTVHAARTTRSGKQFAVDGTVGIEHAADSTLATDLLLRDSAQSNLQALINLNAVNSVVNVLVNLNINIDSQVGELHQVNLASRP